MAEAAGIATVWRDVHGEEQAVGADTLRAVLAAIGLPADAAEARAVLRAMADRLPPLMTMTVGPDGVAIPGAATGHRYRPRHRRRRPDRGPAGTRLGRRGAAARASPRPATTG